jgi:hypothetical protein
MALTVLGVARRISAHEAETIFNDGGTILVSERPETAFVVDHMTNVVTNKHYKWDELVQAIEVWRNRYPNQRFYFVDYEVVEV